MLASQYFRGLQDLVEQPHRPEYTRGKLTSQSERLLVVAYKAFLVNCQIQDQSHSYQPNLHLEIRRIVKGEAGS